MQEFIDEAFIAKWQPHYGRFVRDQARYEQLVTKVGEEVRNCSTLTKPTFIKLIEWKSHRIKPIFERAEFEVYREGIAEALAAQEDEKLTVLDALHGIGAPVASTILHFIYPDEYPIIDFRTAEALYHFGLIESPAVNGKRYTAFRKAILHIREETNGRSLRIIDMALFSYHKEDLSSRFKK